MSKGPKRILFDDEARASLASGVHQAANLIQSVFGPQSKNMAIIGPHSPELTSEACKILKNLKLPDPFENMGLEFAKELTEKMQASCADGSCTSLILLDDIVQKGVQQIQAGSNTIKLKRGIQLALKYTQEYLVKHSSRPQSFQEIAQIATASANGNSSIGNIIATAVEKVGPNGSILTHEGTSVETELEIIQGFCLKEGYISSYFATDAQKMVCELEHPFVLVSDKKITDIHNILEIIQKISKSHRPLLIIADNIKGEALSTLVVNHLRTDMKIAAIKAPSFGLHRHDYLLDICALTQAQYISDEYGISFNDLQLKDLGQAEHITIAKDQTLITPYYPTRRRARAIEQRIQSIDIQTQKETDPLVKKQLLERKANLIGKIAMIKIGAKDKNALTQEAFEHSIHSTLCALNNGVSAGAGMAFVHANRSLQNIFQEREIQSSLVPDEYAGITLVQRALLAPAKQIIHNCGFDASVVLNNIMENEDEGWGFDAEKDRTCLLKDHGILDSTNVLCRAIEYACSMAEVILMTEALIAPEKP